LRLLRVIENNLIKQKYMSKKTSAEENFYTDSEIKFETNNFFEKTIDLILIPILNSLPANFRGFVKKTHRSAEGVLDNVTSHKALEILYSNGQLGMTSKSLVEKIFHKIWFNTNNSKAVRNRLKITKKEIHKAAEYLIKNGEDLNILSIASGSARAVLEAVHTLEIPQGNKVNITFLDKNPEAIKYSKNLVKEFKLSKNFNLNWITDTASNFPKYFKDSKLNIVEMVGLLDYFSDDKVEKIFKMIQANLKNGGTFIAANIDHNNEEKFVTNLVGWSMVYRSAEKLAKLALLAGFENSKTMAYYEPLKIHSVLIIKK